LTIILMYLRFPSFSSFRKSPTICFHYTISCWHRHVAKTTCEVANVKDSTMARAQQVGHRNVETYIVI
jgi:hypothetical protein